MTVEPMDCSAPERGLIPFLAAGTLDAAEQAAAAAHARDCEACGAELAAARELLDGLRATHLTADEIVEAAATGEAPAHLDVCPACRAERDALREVNADLAREERRPSFWRRPELAWAAALVLCVPAGLFFASALRREPIAAPGVTRGPAGNGRAAFARTVVLNADRPTALPRETVVVEFALPAREAGQHLEAELVDASGDSLWAGTVPDDADRGRLVLDGRALATGGTVEVRRVDAAGVERERVVYKIAP